MWEKRHIMLSFSLSIQVYMRVLFFFLFIFSFNCSCWFLFSFYCHLFFFLLPFESAHSFSHVRRSFVYLLIFPSPNWWYKWMETFCPYFMLLHLLFCCFSKSSHEMKNRQNIWMSVAAIAVATSVTTSAAAKATTITTKIMMKTVSTPPLPTPLPSSKSWRVRENSIRENIPRTKLRNFLFYHFVCAVEKL